MATAWTRNDDKRLQPGQAASGRHPAGVELEGQLPGALIG